MTKKTREIQVTQEVVESITCDYCGMTQYEDDNCSLDNIFASIEWTAGYDSNYDMTTFYLDLCDKCMNKLSKKKVDHS